jgi:hypothetical protein
MSTYLSLLPPDLTKLVGKYQREEFERNKNILYCLYELYDGYAYTEAIKDVKNRFNKLFKRYKVGVRYKVEKIDSSYRLNLLIENDDYLPDPLLKEFLQMLLNGNRNYENISVELDTGYDSPIHFLKAKDCLYYVINVNECLAEFKSKIKVIPEGYPGQPTVGVYSIE